MAANVYMRSFDFVAREFWLPLADQPTVMNATIIVGDRGAWVRTIGGAIAIWPPNASAYLEGIDLSQLEASGDAGDVLLVVAYTRKE